MTTQEKPRDQLIAMLQERAKELNCLYRVDEILSRRGAPEEEVFSQLVEALPPGWQFPGSCEARIVVGRREYHTDGYSESPWSMQADIVTEGQRGGLIEVVYTDELPPADEGPFLREERRLINAIAERIGFYLFQKSLRRAHQTWEVALEGMSARDHCQWEVILDFLRRTDRHLLDQMTRRMVNYLCSIGVAEASALLQEFTVPGGGAEAQGVDENRPLVRAGWGGISGLTARTFEIASSHLSDEEMLSRIRSWIAEHKSSYLIETLEHQGSGLAEISKALERHHSSDIRDSEMPLAVRKSLTVSLLRRFFTDELGFINAAKNHVEVKDFLELSRRAIYPSDSRGKLGGKAAGLFLASQIVARSAEHAELFRNLRTPKTWYLTSDTMLHFIRHNQLEDLHNRKYLDIRQIRQEYPHLVQVFKNSSFPPDIVKGLAVALDDFEDRPLIVRSSSLLEDQTGAIFSGKYKSLFLANQGAKRDRLAALQDAIAEVYASVFAPDPIEYRAERGLLDVHEEMGIMIQEVVGQRVGKYLLPALAGVAFSNNEFRWSPRIRREDGLIRLVPGLGTRAVDRLTDDYPVLVAPGQPKLRVNLTADEVIRYSPAKADVINLEENRFETVEVTRLLKECGDHYPLARRIISIVEHDRVRPPRALEPDWDRDDFVVTFEGLISDTPFVTQIATLLKLLQTNLRSPVDIEFACTENEVYLLQCRAQSHSQRHAPAAIPRNIPRHRIVFSADRYVSNGRVPEITHIVYVDPAKYSALSDLEIVKEVGRAVGRLNALLPKRQFILMGPGRWGSRGDIKLGVSVTYSDINNTAVLLEIARQKGEYLPELSFGTHFFQDLVEAGIRYLPLYPDEPGIHFNELFLTRSENILPELVPELAHLADTVRVIDVPGETDGQILRVLMNGDLDEAVGLLSEPTTGVGKEEPWAETAAEAQPEDHWRWRLRMAERIAAHLDAPRFGVAAIYVFGSAKNATSGPASDLDLIVHVVGDEHQRRELSLWLDGWSQSLAEINYLRTGYRSDGLLDIHFVTDEDIAKRTSYAAKIDAVTDAARPLKLGGAEALAH